MTSEGIFRSPNEELAHLNRELAEIRVAMRDLSTRMSQIERHVKRAFGVPIVKRTTPAASQNKNQGSSISPDEVLAIFRELTETAQQNDQDEVEDRLRKFGIPDLKLLAHELGVSFPNKPSRRALHQGIRGRIVESVMLSQNRNVTKPRAEESRSESGSNDVG